MMAWVERTTMTCEVRWRGATMRLEMQELSHNLGR
jgi:hypothetical protein